MPDGPIEPPRDVSPQPRGAARSRVGSGRGLDVELRRAAGLIALAGVLILGPLVLAQALVMVAPIRPLVVWTMSVIGATVIAALWLVYVDGPWRIPFVIGVLALDVGAVLAGALLPIGLDVAIALPILSGMMLVAVFDGPRLYLGLAVCWLAGVVGCLLARSTPGLSEVPNVSPPWLGAAFIAAVTALGYVALALASRRWRALAADAGEAAHRITAATEESRRASERVRALMGSSPLPVLAFDREGLVYAWNPAAERELGWSEEEVLGRSVSLIVPEERRGQVSERVRQTFASSQALPVRLTEFLRKDGSRSRAEIHDALEFDADGRPIGVVVQFLDVSEREAVIERLAEARRLETVGQLAGGIAHDFNNSLTAIAGFASLIASGATTTPAEDAQTILAAAEHSAQLTKQLLAFSRRVTLQPQVVDLSEFAAGVEPLVRSLVGETIALRTECGEATARVDVDAINLEQAVLNLVTNARDAMPDGGDLTISVRMVPGCVNGESSEPETHVAIVVSDTGTGIPPENLPHVFEPFFTTKPVGQGTGLGLPMVHGFVAQSGGHVVVKSPPGEGATFELHFPLASGSPVSPPEHDLAVGGRESILFVEDDPAVASFGLACLRRLGYDVTPAMNGSEAVSLAAARADPFDLLFTDVVIPGMSGPELAAKIHQHHPSTAILYASGYGPERVKQTLADPLEPMLEKPYSLEDLARRVRQILNDHPKAHRTEGVRAAELDGRD